jgi:opacity protein-like surface antigen
MKSLFLCFLLASAAAVATAADGPSLTGKWQVHTAIAGNEGDQTCTFIQKGPDLSGSCTSEGKTVEISGKVDGKKVTWSYKSDYNGAPLTLKYEGTLDAASRITGSASVPEFQADGDFTATLSN